MQNEKTSLDIEPKFYQPEFESEDAYYADLVAFFLADGAITLSEANDLMPESQRSYWSGNLDMQGRAPCGFGGRMR